MHPLSLSLLLLLAGVGAQKDFAGHLGFTGNKLRSVKKGAKLAVDAIPPVNDNCTGAIPLTEGYSAVYNTRNATTGSIPYACFENTIIPNTAGKVDGALRKAIACRTYICGT